MVKLFRIELVTHSFLLTDFKHCTTSSQSKPRQLCFTALKEITTEYNVDHIYMKIRNE